LLSAPCRRPGVPLGAPRLRLEFVFRGIQDGMRKSMHLYGLGNFRLRKKRREEGRRGRII